MACTNARVAGLVGSDPVVWERGLAAATRATTATFPAGWAFAADGWQIRKTTATTVSFAIILPTTSRESSSVWYFAVGLPRQYDFHEKRPTPDVLRGLASRGQSR